MEITKINPVLLQPSKIERLLKTTTPVWKPKKALVKLTNPTLVHYYVTFPIGINCMHMDKQFRKYIFKQIPDSILSCFSLFGLDLYEARLEYEFQIPAYYPKEVLEEIFTGAKPIFIYLSPRWCYGKTEDAPSDQLKRYGEIYIQPSPQLNITHN